ncbi:Asp-tRNA(Asn)/Glu-tRNA(Gln) amidotransferase subunit GatA [Brumimicrobium glaciale]|jgi:aspartyl-tRNA(Asn)/glutamyl-tRNA(Gln) amidotransferase subunit A|uniref:Glutamyl-tRNA(Gln) amidotransferase subunit A n=1 Tax=Brumimicrobium glaciale TaxID=200475 RepID=A0A4Q4KRR6_9FLAO|nr:Asp-tRNA(Asn)/Glu-tRNA(Gln) amidotransferase subunit GatA [Brumimicrobium glaciale]RYM35705.1 Asp-tRNA(Asn)/Glu-tRNA(Gln) amidotransferase subunit GatA [Brumimicrobium glaciale]
MYKTFTEIKAALDKGRTVQDILQKYLESIKERKDLNAFLEVFETSAKEQAVVVDEKIKNGTAGRLAGMVIGIKDNLCYKGHKVSAASKILEGFESIYTATAVERLLAEDAVIIGRLNCDEFAMGGSNENSAYGPVRNALNEDYVPGGSSGGSASAVAAELCTVALGSDTGGSIRQPASFTGTIGFKPTYGRISRYGLIAYASSFDQIGPIAHDIADIALVTEIMAGGDEYDGTASKKVVPSLTPSPLKGKLKIAYIKETLDSDGIDPEVKARIEQLVNCLRADGHELIPVSFAYLEQMVPTYYVLTTAEASSNLSRFDGVHFGYRSDEAKGVEEVYIKSRTEGFGDEVKRRIMAGTFVLSQGYFDAYYTKAQKVRRLIQDRTNEILAQNDLILLPTTPTTAFELNSVKDPIQMYLQDIYTVQANLAGNPAISLPIGKHSNGMPFGLQLIGKHFGEKELLDTSAYLMDFC